MKLELEREHSLPVDVVKTRLNDQITIAKARFGHHAKSYEWQWNENTLAGKVEAYGATCEAVTKVGNDRVLVELSLPILLAPFKAKIIQMVTFRLNKVCSEQGF